ncbi:MAG: methionyl-tRNA formyltransferase, partial [Candidatus Omnitrophica bacterium]|nr:methionyl-tRNA formyltransferase [Candidatus Omnitrophota bacterium]
SKIIIKLIRKMIANKPIPKPQIGRVVRFKRRTPKQSKITKRLKNINSLFDFIRMLDAEGYPRAYLETSGFRFTFKNPAMHKKVIVSSVTIERLGK